MATRGNRRATVIARTAFGTATLRPDPARALGWELLVDGVAQSYVDLGDATFLDFEYVRRVGSVLRLAAPAAVPIRVLHLGGGGLTLPRLVSATRPGSAQRVVERDGELVALVTRELPLATPVEITVGDATLGESTVRDATPVEITVGDATLGENTVRDATPVEITVGDARAALAQAEPAAYDVIVVDVFDGARIPASVAGVGFARAAARVLRPGGLLAMNLTDVPPLAYSRVQVATLAEAFSDVGLIAGGGMFRGRKAGNVILVAGHAAGDLPVRALALDAARDPVPGRVVHGADLDKFRAGAKARLDEPA